MKPTTVSVRVTNWVPPPGCHLPELKLHCSKSVYASNCSCIGGPSGPSALIQTCSTFFPNLRGSNTPYCWSDAGPVIKIRAGPQACSPQLSSLWMLLQRYAGSDCRDDGTSEVLFFFLLLHHITYWPWRFWQQHPSHTKTFPTGDTGLPGSRANQIKE